MKLGELHDKTFLHLKTLPSENYTPIPQLSLGDVIRFSCNQDAYIEVHIFSIHIIPASGSPDNINPGST